MTYKIITYTYCIKVKMLIVFNRINDMLCH